LFLKEGEGQPPAAVNNLDYGRTWNPYTTIQRWPALPWQQRALPLENEMIIIVGCIGLCKSSDHIVNEGYNQANVVFYITSLWDFI